MFVGTLEEAEFNRVVSCTTTFAGVQKLKISSLDETGTTVRYVPPKLFSLPADDQEHRAGSARSRWPVSAVITASQRFGNLADLADYHTSSLSCAMR